MKTKVKPATPVLSISTYEDAVQGADVPRMVKVSVTVDRGFLTTVDDFVKHHPGTSRSAVFDQALEQWAKQVQKNADADCYSSAGKTKAQQREIDDWTAIQTEAAKRIW